MFGMGNQGADSELATKFGGMVRRARRLRDLSQRDLAELAGVSPSSVARAESVTGSTSLDMFGRLLKAAGTDLALVGDGHVIGDEDEEVPMHDLAPRDNGGRRYPAHLDPAIPANSGWASTFELGFNRERKARILRYHHRPIRDRIRSRTSTPADHPTLQELIEHERLRRSRPSWDTPQHRAYAEMMSRARSG